MGLVYDLGVHLLDMAVDLFGMPQQLYADVRYQHEGAKSDDYFAITLYYADGKRVNLVGSKYSREPLPFMTLHGKRGSYIKQDADNQEPLLVSGAQPEVDWNREAEAHWGVLHSEINGEVVRQRIEGVRGDYGAFYRALYEALVEVEEPPVSIEQAVAVLELIEKVYQSAREGRRVVV